MRNAIDVEKLNKTEIKLNKTEIKELTVMEWLLSISFCVSLASLIIVLDWLLLNPENYSLWEILKFIGLFFSEFGKLLLSRKIY